MVAGRAGMMLMLAVAAQGLLVVALATEVFDSLAGEEHNKENGDNDKRHKRRGFLSTVDAYEKRPGRFPRKQERL